MVIRCVMRHAWTPKFQLSGPTVHSYTVAASWWAPKRISIQNGCDSVVKHAVKINHMHELYGHVAYELVSMSKCPILDSLGSAVSTKIDVSGHHRHAIDEEKINNTLHNASRQLLKRIHSTSILLVNLVNFDRNIDYKCLYGPEPTSNLSLVLDLTI